MLFLLTGFTVLCHAYTLRTLPKFHCTFAIQHQPHLLVNTHSTALHISKKNKEDKILAKSFPFSPRKEKLKIDSEKVLFEFPPSKTELIFPTLSILTVIGVIPFVAALARQFWVKYKFTSRRISIQSGFNGNKRSDVVYPDISEMKYVYRAFGSCADLIITLKDGAKTEMRFVPQFNEVYAMILSKCSVECVAKSMPLRQLKTVEDVIS